VLGNHGAGAADGWRIEFDLPAGSEVADHWGASMQRSSQHYVFTQGEHNREIPAGGSVSFGFTVSGSGTPMNCTFQGSPCVTPTDRAVPVTPRNLRVTGWRSTREIGANRARPAERRGRA
jgi:hypothetical protein